MASDKLISMTMAKNHDDAETICKITNPMVATRANFLWEFLQDTTSNLLECVRIWSHSHADLMSEKATTLGGVISNAVCAWNYTHLLRMAQLLENGLDQLKTVCVGNQPEVPVAFTGASFFAGEAHLPSDVSFRQRSAVRGLPFAE